jgi:ABC-type polysaccharide/polyol phosphate export permease
MIRHAWHSLLLNRILLVLAVLASAATAVLIGFLVNLFIQGFSGGNDPTSIAPLAFFFALVFYVVAGIPAQLICGLLWVAYAASRAARNHAR